MKHALLALSLCLLANIGFAQKINLQHVEPPNWWNDMEHSQIEIMLHGKGISIMEIRSSDFLITSVTRTENPNYLFVTIETKGKPAGTYQLQLWKGKKIALTIPYELKQRRENSKNRTGFNSSDVLYLLMPDRFANGDSLNDSQPTTIEKANRNLPGGRHGGDIQGMIDHLDYIQELGATTIWPTPLLEDNDSVYSYHTYGQSDLYKVDPRYGTNSDYIRLVQEAHKRKLKVIQDMVPNHWGYMHWMMNDLPTYSWIHQFPGYAQSNYRMTTQMDINASKRDAKYCMDGWFVPSMPDLNQSNPLVLNYLVQNAIWWIETADLDGFRVDTYSFNDKEGISKWTKAIQDEYPYFNSVGEVWMHDQAQISYWQANSPIAAIQHFNSYLPSVMDFTLHDAIGNAFQETTPSWDRGMIRFYDNFANDFLYDNTNNLLVFMENHDTQRFNEINPLLADYQAALTLIATIRGIPQIYYGTEIGMKGDKGKGDADIRRDFPGGWNNDPKNAFTPGGRTNEQAAYHEITQKILSWRKTATVIHSGKTMQFLPENNVYVYFRYTDTETVMVVINNSNNSQKINLDRYAEMLQGKTTAYDIISGKQALLNENTWTIKGKSSAIYELK